MHYAEDHHVHQLLVLLLVVQQQVHTIPTRNAASMQYYLAALPKSNYIQAQKHQHLWHKHALTTSISQARNTITIVPLHALTRLQHPL